MAKAFVFARLDVMKLDKTLVTASVMACWEAVRSQSCRCRDAASFGVAVQFGDRVSHALTKFVKAGARLAQTPALEGKHAESKVLGCLLFVVVSLRFLICHGPKLPSGRTYIGLLRSLLAVFTTEG
jgi:hypothetical protein